MNNNLLSLLLNDLRGVYLKASLPFLIDLSLDNVPMMGEALQMDNCAIMIFVAMLLNAQER
ncbi:hypothetical protein ABID99_004946 [Mucilaginibacter sp. OAE612]